MNKIATIIKQGWFVTEIRFDRWQNWYYVAASHESGDVATVEASSEKLNRAIDDLCEKAASMTPLWYLKQIRE